MELRHLRYFVAVAEELHFTRAAARLHIAQPPLSQQIKRLEAELQTQLLLRSKRHVELTDAGRAFLDEARKTLAQADHAVRVARLTGDVRGRTIHVGFIDSAAYAFLPHLIGGAAQKLPSTRVVLHELTSGQQVEAFTRSEIDLGLLRRTPGGPRIVFTQIGREDLVVVLPEKHPLASREVVPVSELAKEGWVLFPRALAPGLHDSLLSVCRRAGFAPRVVQEANERHTIVALVGAGAGISIVTAESLGRRILSGVVYRPMSPAATVPMCIAIRRDETDFHVRSLRDIVVAAEAASQS